MFGLVFVYKQYSKDLRNDQLFFGDSKSLFLCSHLSNEQF